MWLNKVGQTVIALYNNDDIVKENLRSMNIEYKKIDELYIIKGYITTVITSLQKPMHNYVNLCYTIYGPYWVDF